MTPLEAIWHPRSVADLRNLPHWRDAEQVAAAVRIYATTGIGFVRRFSQADHPDDWRLYVGAYYARIRLEPTRVHVLRVLRWRS